MLDLIVHGEPEGPPYTYWREVAVAGGRLLEAPSPEPDAGLPSRQVGPEFRRVLLATQSPKVIPHPKDWTDNVHITGYWCQENANEWHPSVELKTFLENGEVPVYVGFGSMAGRA